MKLQDIKKNPNGWGRQNYSGTHTLGSSRITEQICLDLMKLKACLL